MTTKLIPLSALIAHLIGFYIALLIISLWFTLRDIQLAAIMVTINMIAFYMRINKLNTKG